MQKKMINSINKILVSIIIPTYNRGNKLRGAILSILNQTYKDWELIIIDDGSTDNTGEILRPFLNNKKIKYFYQNNEGVSSARNRGIKESKGDYCAFLDSDDEFLVDKLDVQLSKMFQYNFDFSICNSLEIHGKKEIKFNKIISPIVLSKENYFQNKIPISASFFLIKNNKDLYFDKNLKTAEDIDFLLRYLNNKQILFINDCLVKRIKTFENTRLSVNPKSRIDGTKALLNYCLKNKYNLNKSINFKIVSDLYLCLGFWYLFDSKYIEGRYYIKRGLKNNKTIKNLIYYNILYHLSFFPLMYNIVKIIFIFLWKKGIVK